MLQNRKIMFILVTIQLCILRLAIAQDSTKTYDKVPHLPEKIFIKISHKSNDINQKLTDQTVKYLERLAKEERRLKKKLARKDSAAAFKIFSDAQAQYAALQGRIKKASGKTAALRSKYIPHLDTLKTAFTFFDKADGLTKQSDRSQAQLKEAISKMDELQGKFNQAEEVKKFIQQRRQSLNEQLAKYGMAKDLRKLQKQVYYYQAQVEEYKRLFDEPSRIESKALELLSKTAAFKEFFSNHSQLAGLFRLPGSSSGASMVSLAGLQSRESIQQELTQRFGAAPNVEQMTQQHVQGARSQLSQLKAKLNKLKEGGKSNGDPQMPDFKPNDQKVKRFKDRLELGSNLQTVKSNRFFPSTSDIGLSVGYKVNDKSIVGLGSSYKMGWGKDIRHISISHQGIGMRSFVDYKIKGSFWLSGGAELNYRSSFNSFEILNDYTAWQKSALLGLSKKYQAGKKLKGNMQLMYDFLWKVQVPRTQAVVFRVGYILK